jgi:hypothetical protein
MTVSAVATAREYRTGHHAVIERMDEDPQMDPRQKKTIDSRSCKVPLVLPENSPSTIPKHVLVELISLPLA